MEELTVSLEVSIVASGDLVLAAEAGVWNCIRRKIRRPDLTGNGSSGGEKDDHQNTWN